MLPILFIILPRQSPLHLHATQVKGRSFKPVIVAVDNMTRRPAMPLAMGEVNKAIFARVEPQALLLLTEAGGTMAKEKGGVAPTSG